MDEEHLSPEEQGLAAESGETQTAGQEELEHVAAPQDLEPQGEGTTL